MKTTFEEQRALHRSVYWQGQMLRSADFGSQIGCEAQLRWWHNRAIHNAYGIALGFEISRTPQNGTLSSIHLEPGIAYDCFGRALILQTAREIPLPDANGPLRSFTLLACYRETAGFPDPRQTAAVCLSCCDESGEIEVPDFVWKPSESLRIEDGVALGRLTLGVGATAHRFHLDTVFSPAIPKPLARPHLANGSTIPGSTAWGVWRTDSGPMGLETVVDTSAAGFTSVPCYFATLDGLELELYAFSAQFAPVITHVQDPTPNSFRFRAMITPFFLTSRIVRIPPPFVRWLGCQSVNAGLCTVAAEEKPCCG